MGIAVRAEPKIPLSLVPHAEISMQIGLEGDYHGKGLIPGKSYNKKWKRQVTLISYEQWNETCEDLGISIKVLPWYMRRSNILVRNICFQKDDINKILKIGSSVRLQITGETDPCIRMDEVYPGLREALVPDFRGGVTCTAPVRRTVP